MSDETQRETEYLVLNMSQYKHRLADICQQPSTEEFRLVSTGKFRRVPTGNTENRPGNASCDGGSWKMWTVRLTSCVG